MDPVTGTSTLTSSGSAVAANSFAELGSDDFLKLLIMELRNQDPLEPMGNKELLEQISSIRDIELSTTLTDSLLALTGQQNFASASSLIGQYVTGQPGEDGLANKGIVVGVRFAEDGRAVLRLADGNEMPLDQVSTIEPPIRAAEALIGQGVTGIDRRDPSNMEVVEGIATGVRVDTTGEVLLELDTGQDLRFRDILSLASSETI